MQIEGKRVLITGASRGLGRALVKAFVDAGAKMTKEYVAEEILAAIREERHDPPIGDEAKGVFENLSKDARGLERVLQDYRL
jgi:NAD(P)-dependent dehydrogenase (short-subunit alcohol dehydrogenase family)